MKAQGEVTKWEGSLTQVARLMASWVVGPESEMDPDLTIPMAAQAPALLSPNQHREPDWKFKSWSPLK